MNSELDKRCAAALGKPWTRPTHGRCCTCQDCGWDFDNCQCGYSDDEYPEKTRLLEDYIEQHGTMERYAVELMFIVGITPAGDSMCAVGAFDAWRIIRATPQQRAQAFLQVMERCGL